MKMNKEKQIEEMTKEILGISVDLVEEGIGSYISGCLAAGLHSKGYCKAAEFAREIFADIEKYDRRPLSECEAVYVIKASEFAELKKKYTEGGE